MNRLLLGLTLVLATLAGFSHAAKKVPPCESLTWFERPNALGQVHPDFLAHAERFARNQTSAQHVVKVGGCTVVDIWTRGTELTPNIMNNNSLTVTMSVAKFLFTVTMAHAEDNGYFEWKDKISKHWPAFAQNGKEDITIGQWASNGACFPALSLPITWDNIQNGADLTPIRLAIELSPTTSKHIAAFNYVNPADGCTPEVNYGYPAILKGWVWYFLMEKLTGKNGIEYFQTEVAPNLPEADTNVFKWGMSPLDPDNARVANFIDNQQPYPTTYPQVSADGAQLFATVQIPGTVLMMSTLNPVQLAGIVQLPNSPYTRNLFLPAAFGFTNARTLANIAVYFANEGKIGNTRFIGKNAIKRATKSVFIGRDFILTSEKNQLLSGVVGTLLPYLNMGKKGFGHSGLGGSIVYVDEDRELTVSYLTNYNTNSAPRHALPFLTEDIIDSINQVLPPAA